MDIAHHHLSKVITFMGALLSLSAAFLMAPGPLAAAETWQKVQAFGVELEVPAHWKRLEYRIPRSDHDEIQFAENTRNPAAGAWFSVFPKADDLIDPSRRERWIILAGNPARLTVSSSRADDPPPRRRQIVVYFEDQRKPAFLFDGDEEKWPILVPILSRIHESIRLPAK